MHFLRTTQLKLIGAALLWAGCSSSNAGDNSGTGGAGGSSAGTAAGSGGSSTAGSGNGGAGASVTGTGGSTNGMGGGSGGGAGAGIDGGTDSGGGGAGGVAMGSGGAGGAATGGAAGSDGGRGGRADAGPAGPDAGAAIPSAGCGKMRTLQDGNHTIMSGGANRTYLIRTPSDYNNTHPYRVIFMFHWNFGSINAIVNPPDADHNTDRPFYGMADLSGNTTIFIVPMGLISSTGGAGWQNTNNQDVIFTDDMLSAISADLCIDTSRVFTTGFSFGAAMSYTLACVRPNKFRAAVVYEVGNVSGNNASNCTTPIAWFESHGVDDQTIPYSTGLSILNVMTNLNGCTAMTPAMPAQNGHMCVSYQGCSRPSRFCNFGSGENNPFNMNLRGHYPSAKDPGQSTSWVPAEAWNFITQF
jgi:poly(3-hydroxybutyrate) depolymerase